MSNSFAWRVVAVVLLLGFAWRGEIKQVRWPPVGRPEVAAVDRPDDESMRWAAEVSVTGMTPKDRLYCAGFYAALAFVIENDAASARPPVMDTTAKFTAFHAGSLQLAIDKGDVGRYPGLGASIDRAFYAAAGDRDDKPLDPSTRSRFVRCCKALAWRFTIHADS